MGATNGEEMDAYFFEHPGLNEHAAIGEQPHILVIPADKRTKKNRPLYCFGFDLAPPHEIRLHGGRSNINFCSGILTLRCYPVGGTALVVV